MMYVEIVAIGVFALLSSILLARYNEMASIREFVKQIAVWLGIVVLLPMSVWYATSAFSPPPDWKQHARTTTRLDERITEAKDPTEKEKLRAEKDRRVAELDEAELFLLGRVLRLRDPLGGVAIPVGGFGRVAPGCPLI